MNELLMLISPYALVFTTFNFAISLFYNIYGWVVFRRKYKKLSHSSLSKAQKKYLSDIKFVNVHRNWLKKYYKKIRNGSFIYFFGSEILCFAAMCLPGANKGRCILVCRIALFVDIFLLLFWVFLLFYSRKNGEKLAEQHKGNIKKALEDFDKIKSAEHEE